MRVYIGIVVVAVTSMLAIGVTMSSSDLPNYENYSRFLTKGWFFGRKIDNSDIQFRSFRNNIPYLVLGLIGHLGLGRILGRRRQGQEGVGKPKETPSTTPNRTPADASGSVTPLIAEKGEDVEAARNARSFALYNAVFALIFITVLHGTSVIKIVAEIALNYAIARRFGGSKATPILTWALALVLLWWNERGGAQGFGSYFPALAFLVGDNRQSAVSGPVV
jgi:hypothetical protein